MSRVIDWIYSKQWAITEAALEVIMQIAMRDRVDVQSLLTEEKVALSMKPASQANKDLVSQNEVSSAGVAIIPVVGPIFPRAGLFTKISGATSIDELRASFDSALNDSEVRAIIFDIDSPGGEVTGVGDLSQHIRSSRGRKPIISFAYGQMASAAYWLGSAADEVISSSTAMVGSLGVIAALKDTREKDQREGVRRIDFVSSASPYKRLDLDSDEGRGRIQKVVDDTADVLIADIALNRRVSSEKVRADYGRGDMFVGGLAMKNGLVDRLGTLDSTVESLSKLSISNVFVSKGVSTMNLEELKATHPALVEAIRAEEQSATAEKQTASTAAWVTAAVEKERERIRGIESLKVPGAEAIISRMKYQPEATREMVAAAILDEQSKVLQNAQSSLVEDGNALAQATQGVGSAQATGAANPEDEAIMQAMISGVNSKR